MKQPRFGPLLLALFLFFGMLVIPLHYLPPLVNEQKVEDATTSLKKEMFQGIVLQQKMLKDQKYLPMYGSSEFSRLDVYHPSNYFKVNNQGFTPFLVGRGGTQSLIHVLSLAALMDNLEGRKIVFVLSPQWFVKEGLDELHFAPNFSSQQAYHFLFNHELQPEIKKEIAKRLLEFKIVQKDKMLKNSLEGIVYNDTIHSVKAMISKPSAYLYRNILDRKDLIMSMFYISPRKANVDPTLRSLAFEKILNHAENTGKMESNSNTFGIVNHYYNKNIKNKLDNLKGFRAHESYKESPEYKDLQLLLDILKQKKAKPLFISIPFNGPWYDYAGVPKERRDEYYNKIHEQIKKAGFPIVDFSNHEYDKFFLKDTIHIGWKGWVYFNEEIKKFYQNK
ncbi:D-alanyl-lipoteichoic acid biosynthesis protein DltD [Bacillus thuringiensis]|uniref:Protein DltD n=2 Tax=Bacillus thuringiensis TaxID=1428 RepID=A0A9W3NX81_BACTU|nr:D-alanyl-lipoteichoic acid biosynthesis protein DltD [Bacillus thuringiensis]AFQ15695.1 dltD protein [Bacillus thuringiensis HD-771]MEB4894582.1 D-alanyl-lipoteichoic acid biosynthesis protein DltD [Bacillus thuringiensis]MEC2469808.1 D-alanyl-lipoteichoic acid biosynthesis protein DltD [Bacillus thuringiensis]MEC2563012.1 D-alanyl-lipoteichoic acid biosynthesis protein DltD [Bacillus thuringiensis]MEC2645170.1 D-alanyl-lipoteichoic acid biosynthesis protein DltD [Bacillus thuringiensis]